MFFSLFVIGIGTIAVAAHEWYDSIGQKLFDSSPIRPPKNCSVEPWVYQHILIRRTYRRLALKKLLRIM